MDIGVVGISYKEASADLRDAVAFTQSKKIDVMTQLLRHDYIHEVVVLSTCNRSEIYFASDKGHLAGDVVRDCIIDFFEAHDLKERMYVKSKDAAVEHLLKVTTGLDSIILGEDQILGQVKAAQSFAKQLGAGKKILNQTFTKAIAFAKKIKTESKISENPLSISSVVSRYAKELVGDLSTARILMIGAGSINQLCLTYLEAQGATQITMCNRTMCTLQDKIDRHDSVSKIVTVIPYEDRYSVIADMDLVICATSSPHLVIQKDKLPTFSKPIIFFDLAMPLDVDSRIVECAQVRLLNIDDFNQQKEESLRIRQEQSEIIAIAIQSKTQEICRWIQQTKVDPIIASFKDLCLDAQKDTMEIIQKRMDLSEKEFDFIEKMIESSLNRVIKQPIRQLKQLESDEDIRHYKKAIHYLFDLKEGMVLEHLKE